jgi:two-component system OmpR family sensor kinase
LSRAILDRLPLRLKLTLAFAGVMAVVLSAVGLFIYLRFETELDRTIDRDLRTRAGEVGSLVREAGQSGLTRAGRSQLTEQGESFAQVLDRSGQVLDATPQLRQRPLLKGEDLRRAAAGTVIIDTPGVIEKSHPARLVATPVEAGGRRMVVVVGASLDDRAEAVGRLALLLGIGGPVALILASLAGYGVASAALRPVEAMRRKAAAITEHEPGERLPVSDAQDEIARLGKTLNEMLERLEAAFARERTFVSDASHELRTPLAILKAELELALRRGRTEEELLEALRSAAEETDRLARLAEDLLVVARSDRGRLPIRLAAVDAGDLLARLRERFESRAREAGRRMIVDAPRGLHVSADSVRLEQALGNVLDNALRHGDGEIWLSAEQHDGHVELRVHDEGTGFPPAFIGEAFERFSRADEARGRGGTGLGLAIFRSVARAHDGEAYAANTAGGGADVWMELPHAPPL